MDKSTARHRKRDTEPEPGTDAPTPEPHGAHADVLRLQRAAGNQAVSDLLASSDPGQPVPAAVQASMQARLGHDLSDVRLHTGTAAAQAAHRLNAVAFTSGSTVVFGTGAYMPGTPSGDQLLAHELAHVVQQRHASAITAGVSTPGDAVERSAAAAAQGAPSQLTLGGSVPAVQRSAYSDQITKIWQDTGSKASVFDYLRSISPLKTNDGDIPAVLLTIFKDMPDDQWLASTILTYGPEPLWPRDKLDERGQRAAQNKWLPEPGGIQGVIGQSHTSKLPIKAYYFPGQDDTKRALVIGGIHGSELSGVQVAYTLIESLRSGKTMPKFTTIIVPEVFPESVAKAKKKPSTPKKPASNVGREIVVPKQGGGTKPLHPARQYPAPGKSLDDMIQAGGPTVDNKGTRLKDDVEKVDVPLFDETVALLRLIERFRPSRIASVHGMRLKEPLDPAKDAPGIFVDPRGGLDKQKRTRTAEGRADDALALELATKARDLGAHVPGNWLGSKHQTVHYKNPEKPRGFSLGDWGPEAVGGTGPGARPGMTVITVEVENYYEAPSDLSGDRGTQIKAYSEALRTKFLE